MNNWISIKEKLPERSGYFLVYMPQETEGYNIMQFYYCGNNEWDDNRGMADSKYFGITHWQSLPEPPEVTKQ